MNEQPRPDASYVVGVDLGGTNVRAAVVGKDERILGQARNPSDAKLGAARVVGQTALTVREAIESAGLKPEAVGAAGMAVPGHIEPGTGVIIWSPNFGETVDGVFRMFLDVPFTEPVSKAIGLAAFAGNDANIAALGEFRYGAGREVNDMVMFTLGTGIGSGVIVGGRLVTGSSGGAVELGHHAIVVGGRQCGCGSFGCLEAYCGQHAIVERALLQLESGRDTLIFQKVAEAGHKTALTPRMIDEAAQQGDAVALEVFEETGRYLGIGIANAINIFDPARVVIGGGVRKATGLMAAAERAARGHAIKSLMRDCRIVEAALGEDAGVMGAAELAWRHAAGQE